MNVHPSLLPLYRGPSPIQTAILNGETKTGVSLILLDEAIDHGPILAQETAPIGYRDTSETLSHKLALQSARMLQKAIPEWLNSTLSPTPQDHTKATFTKMIAKEDGRIDWKKSAEEIERHVRAMTPWPGSYTFWKENKNEVRLHLRRVSVLKESPRPHDQSFALARGMLRSDNNYLLGEALDTSDDKLVVACGRGILIIHEIQPEGKYVMSSQAFLNGHRSIIGSILA